MAFTNQQKTDSAQSSAKGASAQKLQLGFSRRMGYIAATAHGNGYGYLCGLAVQNMRDASVLMSELGRSAFSAQGDLQKIKHCSAKLDRIEEMIFQAGKLISHMYSNFPERRAEITSIIGYGLAPLNSGSPHLNYLVTMSINYSIILVTGMVDHMRPPISEEAHCIGIHNLVRSDKFNEMLSSLVVGNMQEAVRGMSLQIDLQPWQQYMRQRKSHNSSQNAHLKRQLDKMRRGQAGSSTLGLADIFAKFAEIVKSGEASLGE